MEAIVAKECGYVPRPPGPERVAADDELPICA
ncbi:hypothetical protein F4558_005325 [Micromonospora profundi]|nr:hypothetical protein [Micromonospora profundi]